jgi:large repetitive protein
VAGNLPPGLAVSANGILAGTPGQGGPFVFTIMVIEAHGHTAMQGYTLEILP